MNPSPPPTWVVSYAYYESGPRAVENLRFFLQEGIQKMLHTHSAETVVVAVSLNGPCSLSLPDSVCVTQRDNHGFDWGAHAANLSATGLPTRGAMFLNAGQRGPFLPAYWPRDRHWLHAMADHREEDTGIVAASVFTHEIHKCPVAETWAFYLTAKALEHVYEHTDIFSNAATKLEAVQREDRLTEHLLDQGFALESLLYKYRHQVWRRSDPYNSRNEDRIPSRPWSYADISIHPVESLFYKTHWNSSTSPHENGYECPFEQRYTEWAFGEETPRVLKPWTEFVPPPTQTETEQAEPEPEPEPPQPEARVTKELAPPKKVDKLWWSALIGIVSVGVLAVVVTILLILFR
jgi:hypothetical protein